MTHYLTVKEVSAKLRRHEDTIYRWLKDGKFPNAKWCGDGYLIPAEDVTAILQPVSPEKRT